jgi:ABC-2 type transport system ATP-binding protein
MSNEALAVRVNGLVKRFGAVEALRGLSLSVPRGAFFALLGPNGAGKSTLLGVLTGVLEADAGEVELLGAAASPVPIEIKARIGIVPEELSLFERLTGLQSLTFCARLYGLTGAEARTRADELLRLTELDAARDALVASYSKGMRRRLAIASALIHAPELIFLDEPFDGIDVLAAGVIRELLKELRRRGVTIVLTTHVLEVAEKLATHAAVISQGRLLDGDALPVLLERHRARSLEGAFEALVGAPVARAAKLSFFPEPRE